MKTTLLAWLLAGIATTGHACAATPAGGEQAAAPAQVGHADDPVIAPELTPVVAPVDANPVAPPVDAGIHAAYDALLARHVHDGFVDYTALEEGNVLGEYLETLASVDPARLDEKERFAFWVNAYNAFTLQLIVENHGRIDSIKDISSSKRWKAERWPVNGSLYSLDSIEHEILRPMGDPRVHFALVCASIGCPDLRSEAYLPQTLDEQFDDATRRFLANPDKGLRTVMEKGFFGGNEPNLYLSKIFTWFEEDFETQGDDVVSFVLRYAPEGAVSFIRQHREDLDLEYLDYDWSLNGT